jgi:hypothetical protein
MDCPFLDNTLIVYTLPTQNAACEFFSGVAFQGKALVVNNLSKIFPVFFRFFQAKRLGKPEKIQVNSIILTPSCCIGNLPSHSVGRFAGCANDILAGRGKTGHSAERKNLIGELA